MRTICCKIGKSADLSDVERDMVASSRWLGLSISEIADQLGFYRTTMSRVYMLQKGVNVSYLGVNTSLISENREDWLECFEQIGREK